MIRTVAVEILAVESSMIHDDAHGSRRILAVKFGSEVRAAVIHGDAQTSNAMACSCSMALRIFWFVSVFDQVLRDSNCDQPNEPFGSSKLCVRGPVLCLDSIGYDACIYKKSYVGGRGGNSRF